MYYLKYRNENIFVERNNKIILIKNNLFFNFLKVLSGIESNNGLLELNSLKLNNKNTLIIDATSMTGLVNIFNDDNRIIDEYLKTKLNELEISFEDEEIMNNIIKKYLNMSLGDFVDYSVELDYIKLLKNNANFCINDSAVLCDMIESICKSEIIKHIIVIYKKELLDSFKLGALKYIESDKLIFFEVCDKCSKLDVLDNILIFDNEITQITVEDFFNVIIEKCNLNGLQDYKEEYFYLINKVIFYSIDKKEVDIMEKYGENIKKIVEVLEKEFNLNLMDISGYM